MSPSGQLGLLAAPSLLAPADLDPAAGWQSCGPAALAAITGRSLAAIRPALAHEQGFMSPQDMRGALDRLGFTVADRGRAWPLFGVAMIMFDGPWSEPGLPSGAAMSRSHWVAVSRHDGRGGGELYDVNAPRPMFLDFWRRAFAGDLALALDARATGGWNLRMGLEVTARAG